MSATITFPDGTEAMISDWKWSSSNEELAAALNAGLDPDGPSGSEPDPDLAEAEKAARLFGGRVAHHGPPELNEGLIF